MMNWLRCRLREIGWTRRFYGWVLGILYWRVILILRVRYAFRRKAISAKISARAERLRVCFLLSNASKWKCQSVYDAMEQSDRYEPFVVIAPMDIEATFTQDKKKEWLREMRLFLERSRCKYEIGYEVEHERALSLSIFKPDFVFYTQPRGIQEGQRPVDVSHYALTCYVPYFVQNYGYLPMDCEIPFHREIWRHFTLNEQWAGIFNADQGLKRAGASVGTGHPMLDQYLNRKLDETCGEYVIYAPHWSCNAGERYSTFLLYGERMLDFAKAHSEFKWVFKPHPTLAWALQKYCGWDKTRVEAYYDEWGKFARVSYDSNYIDLFVRSRAMITDCASFLVEYPCCRRPIVHFISSNARIKPHPIAARLFNSYYQVHTWSEFEQVFSEVVVRGNDVKKSSRLSIVKEMNLVDHSAAESIIRHLDEMVCG